MWRYFKDFVKRMVDCYYVVLRVVNIGMIIFGNIVYEWFNFNILFDEILNNYEVKCFVDRVIICGGIFRIDCGL